MKPSLCFWAICTLSDVLLALLMCPAPCWQVPADLQSSVEEALAQVLEERKEHRETFLKLFYKLLQNSAKQGDVEGMMKRLRGLAKGFVS